MKLQALKDKMNNTFKSFSIDKALDFVKKNVRYFSAGALMIALVLILANCTGPKPGDAKDNTEEITETEAAENYQVDAVPAVNELIQNYYTAYAKGSTKNLKKYAKPMTKKEKSYIKMFSKYVEDYENIQCYTKKGLDDSSYLVSVYLQIKFKDVETPAPGLDFFYVRTDKNGALYIDNLYSQFNLLNKEKDLDEQIKALIDDFEQQRDVVELQAKVQNEFEIAIASDKKLDEMINKTLQQAYSAWKQSYEEAPKDTETEVSTENPTENNTEKPATEEPATEEPTPPNDTPAETTETVYALNIVNIRDGASETANLIDTVPLGTALTRTGTTADGWSKLKYNGAEAYVKSEFVSTEAPQVENTNNETSSNAIPEGTKVMLTQTVNVRASMSEDADKVGTAFAGETVTVILSYAEGWTKVNWNDKTGYIKTEFLK